VHATDHEEAARPHVRHRRWTPDVPAGWELVHAVPSPPAGWQMYTFERTAPDE
jgi:hypothetical protein